MDGVTASIVPDLLALALVALVLVHISLNAPPPELSTPLRCGVGGSFLFVVGCVAEEAIPGTASHMSTLVLIYGGHMVAVPAWWTLSLRFARMHGHELPALTSWASRAAPIFFAACFGALLTNPWHGLFLTALPGERNLYEPLWFVFTAGAYGLSISTMGVFAWIAFRAQRRETRRQAALLLTALTLPLTANLAFLLLPMGPANDLTSIGYAISALVLATADYGGRLLSLTPVAFASLLEHDRDAVVLLDPWGMLHYANPKARQLFGNKLPSVGGDLADALGNELRRPGSRNSIGPVALREALRFGIPDDVTLEYLPTAQVLRLDRTAVPGRRAEPAAIALRFRDETRLFHANEQLGEQAATLQAVLDSSRDAFIIVDAEGGLRYANRLADEMWGTKLDVSTPNTLMDFWKSISDSFEDPGGAGRNMERIRQRPFEPMQFELRLKDGRTLETSATPLIREGRLAGRVWQTRDRTAERRSDEALRNAQKLESLGVMAGGIAHDFNNLLVGVLGNAELARLELPEGSSAGEALAAIQLAAEQASDLTRQLLAYAGQDESVSVQPLDLCELVLETRDLLALSTPSEVELRMELPPRPAWVEGDGAQLRQVLMNLVMNACEAIAGKAGTVHVSVTDWTVGSEPLGELEGHALKPGDRVVRLRVRDDGSGMSEETRQRLFDPFFTTKFAGRGLGLAATLGIVRGHGGAVGVESALGRGTTFDVLLPTCRDPLEHGIASRDTEGWVGEGRVLVVDDEAPVRRVARAMLEHLGFEVRECANGREALDAIHRDPEGYRAVLLDLAMPVLSGLDVAIHLAEHHPKLPIVICSGLPPRPERNLPDVAAFVRKPFRRQDLAEALRSALSED